MCEKYWTEFDERICEAITQVAARNSKLLKQHALNALLLLGSLALIGNAAAGISRGLFGWL